MSNPIATSIASAGRPRLFVVGQHAYMLRRVNTRDLRHVGYAVLEGAAAVREVEQQIEREAKELQARLNGAGPERAADLVAEATAKSTAWQQQRLTTMLARPEAQLALAERMEAYACAAVVEAGRLRDDLADPDLPVDAEPPVGPWYPPTGTEIPPADDPSRWLQPTPEGRYLLTLTLVRREEDEDLDVGRVWIYRLSETDRTVLGGLAHQVQEVAAELAPFRREAGAAVAVP